MKQNLFIFLIINKSLHFSKYGLDVVVFVCVFEYVFDVHAQN